MGDVWRWTVMPSKESGPILFACSSWQWAVHATRLPRCSLKYNLTYLRWSQPAILCLLESTPRRFNLILQLKQRVSLAEHTGKCGQRHDCYILCSSSVNAIPYYHSHICTLGGSPVQCFSKAVFSSHLRLSTCQWTCLISDPTGFASISTKILSLPFVFTRRWVPLS